MSRQPNQSNIGAYIALAWIIFAAILVFGAFFIPWYQSEQFKNYAYELGKRGCADPMTWPCIADSGGVN